MKLYYYSNKIIIDIHYTHIDFIIQKQCKIVEEQKVMLYLFYFLIFNYLYLLNKQTDNDIKTFVSEEKNN